MIDTLVQGQSIDVDFEYNFQRYKAECDFSFHTENWGSDRDGNRGVRRKMIDDIQITRVYDENSNPVDVDEQMEQLICGLVEEQLGSF